MSPVDAAKVLDLPPDASPEQLETRFLELRAKLEDKIAKAPTPGLKAKYRESLEQITAAFEALTLAADSSSLPIARKQSGDVLPPPRAGGAAPAASSPGASPPAARSSQRQSAGKEFLIVAVIAVILLASGGWFVVKTRAENAEKARILAAEQAEKERAEAAARHAQALEKEKIAAAQIAQQKRLEEMAANTRVGFAQARLGWQLAERAEREAKQELDELKAAARSRDLTPGQRAENQVRQEKQAAYYRWLTEYLAGHPARRAGVRTEELLSARQIETAVESLKEYETAVASLNQEIGRRKPQESDFFGAVAITTQPTGVSWSLTDAFGKTSTGITPADVPSAGIGPATLVFNRPGWEPKTLPLVVEAGKTARASFQYLAGQIAVNSNPTGAEVWLRGKPVGRTPLRMSDIPAGEQAIELQLADYKPSTQTIVVRHGETTQVNFQLVPSIDREALRREQEVREREARAAEQERRARELEAARRSSGF